MLQLNSNDYGYDAQSLGFPSVQSCQAIVLLTSQGLYGLHDLKAGNPEAGKIKAKVWSKWARKLFQQKGGTMLKLYGVINDNHQYSDNPTGNADWDAMLKDIAVRLKFTGQICKFRITKHIDAGSVYIRFDDAFDGSCQIQYKRWSKMHSNDSDQVPTTNEYGFLRSQRGINADGTDVVTTGYTSQAPGIITLSVNRKGKTHEGTLNTIKQSKMITVV